MPDFILPNRAIGRSHANFAPLKPAERTLRAAVRRGVAAEIAETRPAEKKNDNVGRAGFVRFLVLGGDHAAPVHERGVYLDKFQGNQ